MKKIILIAVLFVIALSAQAGNPSFSDDSLKIILEKITTFADSARKALNVPGAGIAIVRNGKVIYMKGFGYRRIEDSLPVTPQTLFTIASSSKAFCTMSLGILEDEGKIKWDERVVNYIPGFGIKDEYISSRLTITDLVTHRSGMPRYDGLWYGTGFTRKQLVEKLKYLEPSKDFRTDFQYNNLMFTSASYLVDLVSGKTWEEYTKEKIFMPLGMTKSNFSVEATQKTSDFAAPYLYNDKKFTKSEYYDVSAIGGAGSVISTTEDMSKWLLLHTGDGTFNGQRIVSQKNLDKMHAPHMVINVETPSASDNRERLNVFYGMGWFVESYKGHIRVQHGGNLTGFTALVSLLPRDSIGIVVLSNMNATSFPGIVSLYATDLLLGLKPTDNLAKTLALTNQSRGNSEKRKELNSKVKKEKFKPIRPLEEYAGVFENNIWGTIEIKFDTKSKKLSYSYNSHQGELEHDRYDIFTTKSKDLLALNGAKLMFVPNIRGDVDAVTIPGMEGGDEKFLRKPSDTEISPELVTKFPGEYVIEGIVLKVEVDEKNGLMVTVPGQPKYSLEKYKGTEYKFKGVDGFSIEFVPDKKGKTITEAIIHQPNGSFTAVRKGVKN